MEHFISKIFILKIETFLWLYFLGLLAVIYDQFKIKETATFLRNYWNDILVIRNLSFNSKLVQTNIEYVESFLSSRKSLEEKYPRCLQLLKKYTILKFTNTESAKNLDNPENLTDFINAIRSYKDASEYEMLINFEEQETRYIIQETYNKIDFSKNISIGYLKREFKDTFFRYLPIFIYKNLVDFILLIFYVAFKMKHKAENKFFKFIDNFMKIIGFVSSVISLYIFFNSL
ncbi:hypothetical protein [Psychrilyobacter atlanticus]|uniref:hypothetical protein n=1 Tax=Psychrilyobacter atlanticus TaxID=271091 RepID=UPI0004090D0E|nr:hypothetical protein [Psychrilyobacter atlanticus]